MKLFSIHLRKTAIHLRLILTLFLAIHYPNSSHAQQSLSKYPCSSIYSKNIDQYLNKIDSNSLTPTEKLEYLEIFENCILKNDTIMLRAATSIVISDKIYQYAFGNKLFLDSIHNYPEVASIVNSYINYLLENLKENTGTEKEIEEMKPDAIEFANAYLRCKWITIEEANFTKEWLRMLTN